MPSRTTPEWPKVCSCRNTHSNIWLTYAFLLPTMSRVRTTQTGATSPVDQDVDAPRRDTRQDTRLAAWVARRTFRLSMVYWRIVFAWNGDQKLMCAPDSDFSSTGSDLNPGRNMTLKERHVGRDKGRNNKRHTVAIMQSDSSQGVCAAIHCPHKYKSETPIKQGPILFLEAA